MAIPFKTLSEPEIEIVAGFPIRKRDCLTVAEEMAARDLQASFDADVKEKGLTGAQSDLELKQRVATILIQSRLDKTWNLDKTKHSEWEVEVDGRKQFIEPDMNMLDELFLFFMKEQRRGKSIEQVQSDSEASDGTPKKRSTGTKSFGNSSSPTQTKNGSTPKTLEVVPLSS